MDPETFNGIIQLITALGVISTSVTTIVLAIRQGHARKEVEVVHKLVNSYATTQAARIEQLTAETTQATGQPAAPSVIVLKPQEVMPGTPAEAEAQSPTLP